MSAPRRRRGESSSAYHNRLRQQGIDDAVIAQAVANSVYEPYDSGSSSYDSSSSSYSDSGSSYSDSGSSGGSCGGGE